jgi:uncharacterized membrane protein
MAKCKIEALAQRAAQISLSVSEVDGELLGTSGRVRADLEQKLDPLMREMSLIQAEALKFYAGSIKGAAFQLVAARRAVETVRASRLNDDEREALCIIIEKALGSVLRFIGSADKPTLAKLAAFDGAA